MALQDFITHVKQIGMLVGNKFEFVAPSLSGASNSSADTVSMLCTSANLPGLSLMSTEIRHFGEISERPYGIIYPSVNLVFYLDNDLSPKRYFDQWIGTVFNRETRSLNYYDEYTKDVEIVVLNKAEEEIERVKLFECYPKTVNDITLDYHNNTVTALSVNLIYKWWSSSQEENWKGKTGNEEKPTDSMPNFGFDSLGLGGESLSNFTGKTPSGNGEPNFVGGLLDLDKDVSGLFEFTSNDVISSANRRLNEAVDFLGFSNLDDNLLGQIRNTVGNLNRDFNGIGTQILSIENDFLNTLPNLSDNFSNLAIDSTILNTLMNQIGPVQNISDITGQLTQMSNNLSSLNSINELAPYLDSISSNVNQIGSSIARSSKDLNTISMINSATNNAFNSISRVYNSTSSSMNKIATAIRK